jgi:hypothetical protein
MGQLQGIMLMSRACSDIDLSPIRDHTLQYLSLLLVEQSKNQPNKRL